MKHKSKKFFNNDEYKQEEVGPAVLRKITGFNDDIMVVLVKFEK